MPECTIAKAPGKLILSGEHAVVYGAPAIACAIDRHVTVAIEPRESRGIQWVVPGLAINETMQHTDIFERIEESDKRYLAFLSDELPIESVLRQPLDLVLTTYSLLLRHCESYNTMESWPNLRIQIDTTIPMGCGMGSSSALINALLLALRYHCDLEIDDRALLNIARKAENRQHGKSSGIDLHTSFYGGAWLFRSAGPRPLNWPANRPDALKLYWLNTGPGQQSTGACVTHASHAFDQAMLDRFTEVTESLAQALCSDRAPQLISAITENHLLLKTIGVVPDPVNTDIEQLQAAGIAAKISGAGALTGDAAGCLICYPTAKLPTDLDKNRGLKPLKPLIPNQRGAYVSD